MNTKNLNAWLRKALYGTMMLAVLLSAFGGVNLKPAYAQEAQPALTISLSADKASFSATEDVSAHVTISNPGSQTVKVLKWFTPFGSAAEPLLDVSVDGAPVAFTGAIYKRTPPTEQDYVTLDAGASMSGDINLGSFYNLSASGNYSATYNVASNSLFWDQINAAPLAGSLSSSALVVYVAGHEVPQPVVTAQSDLFAAAGTITFDSSCTANEQTLLLASRTGAYNYATDAVNYFNNGQQGARYTTWFKAYDATRYNTVKTHFINIKSYADTHNIKFNCADRSAGIYAYVYPNDPSQIWLCGAFWSSPTTGTDSKSGTLVHEMSHFTINGGTDDFAYGKIDSMALTAAQAIMNADNHEYFVENNPSLETTNPPAATTYTISGNAGIAGAVLGYTDVTAKTATADISGNYAFTVSSGWSGTVTPSKAGYTFSPVNKSYANVLSNQTLQNYTAAPVAVVTYTISGNAGVAGATLSYTDVTAKTATADISGNYTFTVSSGWSGTVTPSKAGYTFTPLNKSYANVLSNQTLQNYTAAATPPPSSGNLLLDPSFEAYATNSPWAQTSTNFGTPLCTVADCGTDNGIAGPRTGAVWSWFGGILANEDGSLSQSMVFPNGSASLGFYLWIGSAAAGSDAADLFAVKIDNTQVFSANATQAGSYPSYTLVTVDVSAFANGAAHTVTFWSTTTGQAVTFNVDDVSLTGSGVSQPPTTQTAVFGSMATYDGWILESLELSGKGGSVNSTYTYFVVGDNAADKQYRSVLHFNTSALPDNAVITSVNLNLKKQGVSGTDPFGTHGNLLVDIRKSYFGIYTTLELGDFQTAASFTNAAAFNPAPVDNWYNALLGNSSYGYVNLAGSTQFRLRFALDDNDDLGADFIKFFSGNYTTASLRPQLIVEYYVP